MIGLGGNLGYYALSSAGENGKSGRLRYALSANQKLWKLSNLCGIFIDSGRRFLEPMSGTESWWVGPGQKRKEGK